MRLALVYAFTGDRENSLKYLRLYRQTGSTSANILKMREDPLFESIKDDPEFQEIINDLESDYHEEHNKVQIWLKENGILL